MIARRNASPSSAASSSGSGTPNSERQTRMCGSSHSGRPGVDRAGQRSRTISGGPSRRCRRSSRPSGGTARTGGSRRTRRTASLPDPTDVVERRIVARAGACPRAPGLLMIRVFPRPASPPATPSVHARRSSRRRRCARLVSSLSRPTSGTPSALTSAYRLRAGNFLRGRGRPRPARPCP